MTEAAFRASLESGFTTRARCWRVARRDGVVLGFTDHDRPLTFEGVTFEPGAALAPSEAVATLGLSAGDQEISGALSSDAITEADLRRGAYDGAEVRVWDVDWTDVSARALAAVYVLGEVERTDSAFVAEVQTRAAGLERRAGRHILATCDAEFGDARCGADVTVGGPNAKAGTVEAVNGLALSSAVAKAAPAGFFDRGVLTWTAGRNAGARSTVRRHSPEGAGVLDLWRAPPFPPEVGDEFTVRAGCNKEWGTCAVKFANAANFRGFPHVPSESFPVTYARRSDSGNLDGGTDNAAPYVPAAPVSGPDP